MQAGILMQTGFRMLGLISCSNLQCGTCGLGKLWSCAELPFLPQSANPNSKTLNYPAFLDWELVLCWLQFTSADLYRTEPFRVCFGLKGLSLVHRV